jgi:hypothetical protein
MQNSRGYILLTSLVFTGILLMVSSGLITYTTQYARSERKVIADTQALALAEAAVDKAIAQLNANGGYTGETNTPLGGGTFTISVSSINSTNKRITATGYIPDNTDPVSTRTIKVTANIDTSLVAFRYGVHSGQGGVNMNNNSEIEGNLYSNGNVTGSGVIGGDATVASNAAPLLDQQWTTQNGTTNLGDISNRSDIAEAFTSGTSTALNKVSLYVRKVGNPGDVTVRIVSNNAGNPSKTVLATGTLIASHVTGSLNFVDVLLTPSPTLSAGTTYWIIADASVNASNYFVWGSDTAQGYSGGTGKSSANWNAGSPVWTTLNQDLNFKTWNGGAFTSLSGVTVTGNAWAHALSSCTIMGNATYQTISSCTVGGTSTYSATNPDQAAYPISDAQIREWEEIAEAGGVITGPYTITSAAETLGPIKINGNLTVTNNATLTIAGPIWVNGNVTFSNNAHFNVAASTGNSGAILIAHDPTATSTKGLVTLSNNFSAAGNGNPDSFPMIISMSSSASALLLANNAASIIFFVPYGTLTLDNNSGANSITAFKIQMNNNAVIDYQSGLQNASFSNGPGGSWAVLPGSYVITQ